MIQRHAAPEGGPQTLRSAGPAGHAADGMPIRDFLAAGHLRCSDIMLTRAEWNAMSWLIRNATDANFAHAGLVFLRPEPGEAWRSTFLIESVFGGVDITDLADYFEYARLSVAIRRLDRPWFDERLQRRVRARMLDEIDAEYDYSTMFRLGRNGLFGAQRMIFGHKRAVGRRLDKHLAAPKEFICSGFIQQGFAAVIAEEIERGAVPEDALADVIFDRDLADAVRHLHRSGPDGRRASPSAVLAKVEAGLLSVTPRDFEVHSGLEWVWVLTGGRAHAVSSYADACKLLGCKPVRT